WLEWHSRIGRVAPGASTIALVCNSAGAASGIWRVVVAMVARHGGGQRWRIGRTGCFCGILLLGETPSRPVLERSHCDWGRPSTDTHGPIPVAEASHVHGHHRHVSGYRDRFRRNARINCSGDRRVVVLAENPNRGTASTGVLWRRL